MLRRIHVHESRFVLGCFFSSSAHLGKSWTRPFLKNRGGKTSKQRTIPRVQTQYHTLDRRSSVTTLQTSLCLTTSQAWCPSQSSTLDTGLVARSRAYSAGGSTATGREKGNLGGPK